MGGNGKKTTATPARRADASGSDLQALRAMMKQKQSSMSEAETLKMAVDVYKRYLEDNDSAGSILDELAQAQFLQTHVWRLHALAVAPSTAAADREAWLRTAVLLLAHTSTQRDSVVESAWTWATQQDDCADAWDALLSTLPGPTTVAAWPLCHQSALLQLLIHCYAHVDVPAIAKHVLPLVSLPLWHALSASQRAIEFQTYPKLARHWTKRIARAEDQTSASDSQGRTPKRRKVGAKSSSAATTATATATEDAGTSVASGGLVVALLDEFLRVLTQGKSKSKSKTADMAPVQERLRFVALMLELLIDLLGQLPTRRFLLTVLRRRHVTTRLRHSALLTNLQQGLYDDEEEDEEGDGTATMAPRVAQGVMATLLARFERVLHAPQVDAHTGHTRTTLRAQHEAVAALVQPLQGVAFRDHRDTALESLAVVPLATIRDRQALSSQLHALVGVDRGAVEALGVAVGVFADAVEPHEMPVDVLVDCLVDEYAATTVTTSTTTMLPTEMEIWSETIATNTTTTTAEPKLGLQYLNLTDFLQRSYEKCYRATACAMRQQLETAIRAVDAVSSLRHAGETEFRGFVPHAAPLRTALSVTHVAPPRMGQTEPAQVLAQFDVALSPHHEATAFDRYAPGELLLLVTLRATKDAAAEAIGYEATANETAEAFPEAYGVMSVRGATLVEVRDAQGGVLFHDEKRRTVSSPQGSTRSFTVALEAARYHADMEAQQKQKETVSAYEYVNLLVRPRLQGAAAVNEKKTTKKEADGWTRHLASAHGMRTISELLQRSDRELVLPAWLYDLFLGYGEPLAATYEAMAQRRRQYELSIPLGSHLFLDGTHAVECLSSSGSPLRILPAKDAVTRDGDEEMTDGPIAPSDAVGPFTLVESLSASGSSAVLYAHRGLSSSPAPSSAGVRVTRQQAEAIKRGTCEGLTLVSGAKGAGKTTTAVRILQNLYETTPRSEKIVVVAPTESALQAVVQQLTALSNSVDAAHVVRLSDVDDSKPAAASGAEDTCAGRVQLLLQRRLDFLQEAGAMAQWLETVDVTKYAGVASAASYSCEHALYFYRMHVQPLVAAVHSASTPSDAQLHAYLQQKRKALSTTDPATMAELVAFADQVGGMFGELERLQSFELMQATRQRSNLYLIQHARVLAMTSAQLASQRQRLAALRLHVGSVVVDDASQVSELDSFLALVLAAGSSATAGPSKQLQRAALLGDRNAAEGSLFARLLRLGVPSVELQPSSEDEPMAPAVDTAKDDASAPTTKTMAKTKTATTPAKASRAKPKATTPKKSGRKKT